MRHENNNTVFPQFETLGTGSDDLGLGFKQAPWKAAGLQRTLKSEFLHIRF